MFVLPKIFFHACLAPSNWMSLRFQALGTVQVPEKITTRNGFPVAFMSHPTSKHKNIRHGIRVTSCELRRSGHALHFRSGRFSYYRCEYCRDTTPHCDNENKAGQQSIKHLIRPNDNWIIQGIQPKAAIDPAGASRKWRFQINQTHGMWHFSKNYCNWKKSRSFL